MVGLFLGHSLTLNEIEYIFFANLQDYKIIESESPYGILLRDPYK